MSRYPSQNYDMSGMFLTEKGKGGFDEVDLTEEDSFELGANEVLG